MAYITVSTEDGEFTEFHTADKDDAKIKAYLLDRSVERALAGPTVDELRDMLTGNPWGA